ncbi:hypothetical protein BDZ89DRAFT_1055837 [Hymenopellis radicata]|nr:hypothetical protein BDZ89DRAFT_1055837 [Hymenopellis radicata]
MAPGLFLFFLFCCRSLVLTYAQSISTSITVPPLQWINLTNHLSGSTSPPALKDATIGYDETSRSLIVFGGESQAGVAQSTTYLLNLDSLTWSIPRPPDSLDSTPAARSSGVAGCDFAASNRHGFVVIGGKGSSGQALSDVWEFDFTNQFWAQVQISAGAPPARWGAVGGIDIRTAPIQDSVVPGPNNTLYLVGGTDGSQVFSLSDVWRLNISGALSSNLVNDTSGSWDRVSFGNLPSRTGAGGTVLHQQVIAVGGCGSSSGNESCVKQDSYILNTADDTGLSPTGCPVPRTSPVVVANTNTFSTSFSSQVFLLLGTFDDSLWSDGGNLAKGEVAILDTNTLTWSRVLPSGDPGDNGLETFPSPRKGAAALAYSSALVGTSRNAASDIIVFGGQDDNGDYLSEVWILRAYNGSVTSSSSQWSGYGTGDLETGVDASGVHVSVQILSECAKALSSSATSTTSSQSPTSSTGSPGDGTAPSVPLYDTSFYHKLFAPLSLAALLPGLILFRLFSPVYSNVPRTESAFRWIYLSGLIVLISYGMGVAALALSFATTTLNNSVSKRSTSDSVLKTGHGKVGLAFFIGLYAVVPTLLLLLTCSRHRGDSVSRECESQKRSTELTEKLGSPAEGSSRDPIVADYQEPSRSTTPRMRTPSFGTSVGMMRPSGEDPLVSDSESLNSGGPQRTFEVMSRPPRHQKNSGSSHWLSPTPIEPQQAQRTLAEIDWLQRRRSLNAVDELDYAITQRIRAQQAPSDQNVAQSHSLLTMFPPWLEVFIRFLLHFFFLGLCIVCLVALNARAPASTFGVFLAWVVLAYIFIIYLAWIGRPPLSTLTIIFLRLRTANSHSPPPESNSESRNLSSDGPYLHQPSHRVAPDRQDALSHGHARSAEDDDEDEDEDTRQQRMERELDRRQVSTIVTVPKRKLWITNPS